MEKITKNRHYILYIRTNDIDKEYPEMDMEYFSNITDMLKRIDEIAKENLRQGKSCTRHIEYDYIYLL